MDKRYRSFGVYIILVIVIALLLMVSAGAGSVPRESAYTEVALTQDLEDGNLGNVQIYPNREVPSGEVRVALKDGGEKKMFTADVNQVVEILKEHGFGNYQMAEVPEENWLLSILPIDRKSVV